MKSYTLKDIVKGQEQAKTSNYNTDLFAGDRETLEAFDKGSYSMFWLTDTDHTHDKGEHDNLKETVIAVGHENDFYMITAITTDFNGEVQHKYSQQEITLKGFKYFTKDVDEDFTEIYDNYLVSKGYEITLDDIKTVGELSPEYNCTTLRFKDENENMHYLTVNSKDQLSSVTVKMSAREAKPTTNAPQSAFA